MLRAPSSMSSLAVAIALAPAPVNTIFTSLGFLLTTFRAFRSAARVTTGWLFDGQVCAVLRVVVDRHAHARHPGGVGHREVVAGLDRHPAVDLYLAAQVHEEGAVGDVHHRHPGHPAQPLDDALAVGLVGG